ncbi:MULTISPECIES: hypothetical protein [Chelativorans]|jgi:hypothetical protein|uniref:Phage integrase n=1 Tax=Chelativorans sp. (strain BNC1) TaxID=266779 RepID=Q11J49_CHESB|nr:MULTISPECIES: hypothetical protein [Chelativorans]
MGKVKIRYYTVKKGRGYWQPTQAMRSLGFNPVSCGPDGPAAWAKAEKLNTAWDARLSQAAPAIPDIQKWPAGSIGEAFDIYRQTPEWAKKAVRTREDWERGWKYIGPVFGRFSPLLVTMPVISEWRQGIEDQVSLREAHRAMKIWRALWKVMAAMRYCTPDADPSFGVRNTEPKGRRETWKEGEAVRLVKRAIRMKYLGLAAALACMWDGAVAPVDARKLTLAQRQQDDLGTWFELGRAKTGRDAVLTLSRRTERLLNWYLEKQFGEAEPIGSMCIFRTRRGAAYTKNSFAEDFRDIRNAEFPGDTRKMLDFRRSGSVEAVAGGVEGTALSAKLANSLSQSKKLEQTYVPVHVEMVRAADAARKLGREKLRGKKTG